jgi:hypothetical protein
MNQKRKRLFLGAALVSLMLGCPVCSSTQDPVEPEQPAQTVVTVTLEHPKYIDGEINVLQGDPITIAPSDVKVSITPPQDYTLEFVAVENEYFTFSSAGLLTGLQLSNGNRDIVIRVLASDGTMLKSLLIPVNVLDVLVSMVNFSAYERDTLRVVANSSLPAITADNVKLEPEQEHTVAFVPDSNTFFTFTSDGVLSGKQEGKGAIAIRVYGGDATLIKERTFPVLVSPDLSWVKSVAVMGAKTVYGPISNFQFEDWDFSKRFLVDDRIQTEKLSFRSTNDDFASVDATSGVVTVNRPGHSDDYTFIVATATDGSLKADSIRITSATQYGTTSCDWNLCNIIDPVYNFAEDPRYVSCMVWDGDISTAWVYRVNASFTRDRYPGVSFLMGRYGKEADANDDLYPLPDPTNKCGGTPAGIDYVTGECKSSKKEANWGIWSYSFGQFNLRSFNRFVITRGSYITPAGKKVYMTGTVYLEVWDNRDADNPTTHKVAQHTFTSDPNDNVWDLNIADLPEFADGGLTGTELQMMISAQGGTPDDGSYYFAIADVLVFEEEATAN